MKQTQQRKEKNLAGNGRVFSAGNLYNPMKKRKDHLEESNKRGRWKMREKERRGACVFCLCIWPLCCCCCCYIVYVNDDGELS